MVDYSGSNAIEIEDDVFEEVNNFTPMPQYIPGLPEKPELINPKPEDYFNEQIALGGMDDASYLKEFATPTFTDEQIEKLYAPSDYSSDKGLALMRLGLGLMQPTRGGQIGAAISAAGTQYANEISKIKQLQRAENKANRQGILTAKLQQRAAQISDKKALWDLKNGVASSVAEKKYNAAIDKDKITMEMYNDMFKAAKGKQLDYYEKGFEPVKGDYILPNGQGGWSDPFTAYTINVPGKGIQFYRPTDVLDKEGLPQLELITNPLGIREMTSSMQDTVEGFKGSGTSGLQDILTIKGELDTFDQNILYLSDLARSIRDAPNRAGFLAGIHKTAQDFGQIASDAMNVNFNSFFKDGNENLGIKPNTKLAMSNSVVERYVQFQMQDDLASGKIDQAEADIILAINDTFQKTAILGQAALDADVTGDDKKSITYDNEIWTKDGFVPAFESAEEQDKIIKKLRWFDTDLPLNEARANAIIYAIARARKSSGRLNLDDIERAAKDLNIFGMTSSASVVSKLGFLEQELLSKRNAAYTSLGVLAAANPNMSGAFAEMKNLGYGSYSEERIRGLGQANPDNSVPQGPKLKFGFDPTTGAAVQLPE